MPPEDTPCAACRAGFHDNCFMEICECPCNEPDPWDGREEMEALQPRPDVNLGT